MRVLIADDEAPLREWLRHQLQALDGAIEVVAETGDGPATLAAIERTRPDVAFLDIRMPGCTGLDVAARCAGACHVVFVTAYDEFALEAFERAALDYLVKPVRGERLARTLERLRPLLGATRPSALPAEALQQLLQALRPTAAPQARPLRWLTAGSGDQVRLIDVLTVDHFAAQDKYTEVRTARETALVRTPLSRLEEELDPETFWRIHRGHIVRVAAIEQVRRDMMGRLTLRLSGHPESLPVSRAFSHRFKVM
ncbi:MAG: two component transcriptional regulator, LytTR family [Rhodocyclaceae bacterium]|nr:two component transcriptional regulator, LytTR family [Rhodocyclaceae bacterium]